MTHDTNFLSICCFQRTQLLENINMFPPVEIIKHLWNVSVSNVNPNLNVVQRSPPAHHYFGPGPLQLTRCRQENAAIRPPGSQEGKNW